MRRRAARTPSAPSQAARTETASLTPDGKIDFGSAGRSDSSAPFLPPIMAVVSWPLWPWPLWPFPFLPWPLPFTSSRISSSSLSPSVTRASEKLIAPIERVMALGDDLFGDAERSIALSKLFGLCIEVDRLTGLGSEHQLADLAKQVAVGTRHDYSPYAARRTTPCYPQPVHMPGEVKLLICQWLGFSVTEFATTSRAEAAETRCRCEGAKRCYRLPQSRGPAATGSRASFAQSDVVGYCGTLVVDALHVQVHAEQRPVVEVPAGGDRPRCRPASRSAP